MKFSVNAQEMKAAMSLVNKAIASKPTLPIMSCVKLESDANGNLTLTGGSEGTFMTLTVPMFEVQDFHPVCIEAAILRDTLGTLGKQNATFQVDGTSATLVYSTRHFNFAVQSTDEYPTVQDNIEAVDAFTMTATDFSKMISTCRAYTIDDELRPVMGGVYLDLKGEHLVMAASDGHRMIRKAFPDVKAWVKTVYFDDETIWGPGKKKLIRELRQSETCLFFVKSETEAGALTADDIVRLRKEYYAKPDPDPCIDPETGQPYELTEDERLEWEIYMLKKQGNYAKANKLFNERNGVTVAAEALPEKQQAKTWEVKDEELPF